MKFHQGILFPTFEVHLRNFLTRTTRYFWNGSRLQFLKKERKMMVSAEHNHYMWTNTLSRSCPFSPCPFILHFRKKKHFFRLVVVGFQFRFVGYVYFTCIDSNIWINADIRTPWSYIYFMYSFGRRHIRICKFSLGQGAYLQVIARLPSTTVRR